MKKTLITIVVTALACFCVIGTTFAFLVDKTNTIENTFTVGSVDITLTESDDLDLKLVPGKVIKKDPTVTVAKDSEACWLFVKVAKYNNVDTYLTVAMDSKWKLVDGETDVYWCSVTTSTADQAFGVFAGDQVVVKSDVTKAALDSIKSNPPKIYITAYAVQAEGFNTAELAWAEASKLDSNS